MKHWNHVPIAAVREPTSPINGNIWNKSWFEWFHQKMLSLNPPHKRNVLKKRRPLKRYPLSFGIFIFAKAKNSESASIISISTLINDFRFTLAGSNFSLKKLFFIFFHWRRKKPMLLGNSFARTWYLRNRIIEVWLIRMLNSFGTR